MGWEGFDEREILLHMTWTISCVCRTQQHRMPNHNQKLGASTSMRYR